MGNGSSGYDLTPHYPHDWQKIPNESAETIRPMRTCETLLDQSDHVDCHQEISLKAPETKGDTSEHANSLASVSLANLASGPAHVLAVELIGRGDSLHQWRRQ